MQSVDHYSKGADNAVSTIIQRVLAMQSVDHYSKGTSNAVSTIITVFQGGKGEGGTDLVTRKNVRFPHVLKQFQSL